MTISKKHYIKFAEILKKEFEDAYIQDELCRENQKATAIIANVYWKLTDYFESENPDFNRDVFEKATTINYEQLKKDINNWR